MPRARRITTYHGVLLTSRFLVIVALIVRRFRPF
jgi:hypothetical protein